MILIREVADAPVIMGISKPAGLKSPCGEVKIVNPLFVGIDVSSRNNVAYLMKPDGSKHSSFSVQNNLGGAKLLSERIVSALRSMQLSDVVIGLEATSIYGDSLVYALREDGSLGRFQRKIHVLNPKQVRKVQGSLSRPAQERLCGRLCDCRPSPFRQDRQGGLYGRLPLPGTQNPYQSQV